MTGTLNKVMLIGHTGDDVKMHYFDGGSCIGRFPVATNEEYTNKSTGERVSNTEWHNVVVRNKGAEVCEKYLKKGDKVYIEGRIKTRKWQDDQGIDRYSTEVQCTNFRFLSQKDPNSSGNYQNDQNNQNQQSNTPKASEPKSQKPQPKAQVNTPQDDEDDDLPF